MTKEAKHLYKHSRIRRFVFTVNNYNDEDVKKIKQMEDVRAITFGREKGKNGVEHLQGAVLLSRAVNFSTIKKRMPKAHIERMNGTPLQAFEYCWKEDPNPFKFGEMPKPGKRNDLKNAVRRIQEGDTIEELAMDPDHGCVVVKFSKGIQFLQNCVNQLKPLNDKKIMWLYGSTGIGKTRTAIEFCEKNGLSYWISNADLKWFDRYNGQDVVIIDDFRYKHCSFSFLLRLLDRYELNVPVKGGFVRWNPKIVFVTTPLNIDDTFRTDWRKEEDLKQISRRVHFEWNLEEGPPRIILETFRVHCQPSLKNDDEELVLIENPTAVRMSAIDLTQESEEEEEKEESWHIEDTEEACWQCGFAVCVCTDSESDIFAAPPGPNNHIFGASKFF